MSTLDGEYMSRKTVLTIVLVGLCLRLLPALEHRHFNPLIDDSYYALTVARNIAEGRGITNAGIPTNGFQPLFVLLAAPFYFLLGGHGELSVYMILVAMAVLGAATGLLIYVLLNRMGCRIGAMFGLIIWSFSPYVIWNGVNGLETGLAAFFLAWSAWYYVARVRSDSNPGPGRFAVLGLLLGLGVLSRIDMGFWAVAIAADSVLFARDLPLRRRIGGMALAACTALLVCAPWFAWNIIAFGDPLPTSGSAVRYISLSYGYNHWGQRYGYLPAGGIPLKYYALSLAASVKEMLVSFDTFSTLFTRRGMVFLIAILVVLAWRRLFETGRKHAYLLAFPLLQVAAYSFWIFGQWFYPRYYYTAEVVLILWFCVAVEAALVRMAAGLRGTKWVLGLVSVVLLLLAWDSIPQILLRREFRSRAGDRAVAEALMTAVPEGSAIGMFQSGAGGYYVSGRRVVNLDGVVNGDALRAMKESRMAEYLRKEKIDWLCDWDWILDALYVRKAGEQEPFSGWELVKKWGKTALYQRVLTTGESSMADHP